jgi:hypothetical protein
MNSKTRQKSGCDLNKNISRRFFNCNWLGILAITLLTLIPRGVSAQCYYIDCILGISATTCACDSSWLIAGKSPCYEGIEVMSPYQTCQITSNAAKWRTCTNLPKTVGNKTECTLSVNWPNFFTCLNNAGVSWLTCQDCVTKKSLVSCVICLGALGYNITSCLGCGGVFTCVASTTSVPIIRDVFQTAAVDYEAGNCYPVIIGCPGVNYP